MSSKLTPEMLRKMVIEERNALLEEAKTPKAKNMSAQKSINHKIDYLKKLKLKEADLTKRLKLISKTREMLKNKVTEEL